MKYFSSLSSVENLIASLMNSTVNFTQNTDMNHEEMSAISVFKANFTMEFTSLAMNFLESHEF